MTESKPIYTLPQPPTLPGWFVVERLGHRTSVGWVQEVELGGGKLLLCSLPGVDGLAAEAFFFGPNAVYQMTPTTEATVVEGRRAQARDLYLTTYSRPAFADTPVLHSPEADDEAD